MADRGKAFPPLCAEEGRDRRSYVRSPLKVASIQRFLSCALKFCGGFENSIKIKMLFWVGGGVDVQVTWTADSRVEIV